MLLSDLNKGEGATIININASDGLKERFYSFGIMKGEEVLMKECSLGKQTIEIQIGSTFIALRIDEADKIEIDTNSH
ncbi:MAG: FeoA family protein [Campylobacterota bacterium]|nr:FeoA family protein [Campylobacterota bacterium]